MDISSNKPVTNRSVPACTVIPVLAYEDVGQAVDWLCNVFGFTERLRIGDHRAQLMIGDGAVIVNQRKSPDATTLQSSANHSLLIQVANVDHHYEEARRHGAHILQPPTDHPYGERQYTVEDPGGHNWTFSQSIADVAPEEWGATLPRQTST